MESLISLGVPEADEALLGGLKPGALHEIFAERGDMDSVAVRGFALALALRGMPGRPLIWIREDITDREEGQLYAPGLAAFGHDPANFILVRVRDALSGLRAAHESARCQAVGAVLLQIRGKPKILDLTATRRLSMAAQKSGVTVFLLRVGAEPAPSAAETRWSVRTMPSRPIDEAPGLPTFEITLVRHRGGLPAMSFCVEWDHEAHAFRTPEVSSDVAALPVDRPPEPDKDLWSLG